MRRPLRRLPPRWQRQKHQKQGQELQEGKKLAQLKVVTADSWFQRGDGPAKH